MTLLLILLFVLLLLVLSKPSLARLLAPAFGLLVLALLALWAAFLRIYINVAELIVLAFLTLLVYVLSQRSR